MSILLDWSAVVETVTFALALAGAVISLWVRSQIDQRVAKAVEKFKCDELAPLQASLDNLKTTVIAHDRQLIRIEEAGKSLPTRGDVEALRLQIERLGGTLGQMQNEMKHLGQSSTANGQKLDRLEQHIYRDQDARGSA